jgi:hypothetical protein
MNIDPPSPLRPSAHPLDQRPDGFGLDWKRHKLFILEFTRPYDTDPDALQAADQEKRTKYQPLQRFLQTQLPPPWTVEIVTFSIGVLGSADETAWETALETLTIPVPHRSKMVKAAIATALEGYTNILAARYALLQGPDG